MESTAVPASNIDKHSFEGQHEALCGQLMKVLEADSANILSTGLKKSLEAFKKRFGKLKLPEQHDMYASLFKKKRILILAAMKDDWLRNTKNSDKDELRLCAGKSHKGKVSLSAIYRTAIRLREEAEIRLKDKPEEWDTCLELLYPDTIKLHLYRIWAHTATTEGERDKLRALAERLSQDLQSGTSPDAPSSSTGGSTSGSPSGAPGLPPGFNGAALTGMLQQMGLNTQAPMNMGAIPSGQDVTTMIRGFVSDPRTSEIIGTAVDNIRSAKSLDQVLGAVISGFQDGNLLQQIQTIGQSLTQGITSMQTPIPAGSPTPQPTQPSQITQPPQTVPITQPSQPSQTADPLISFPEETP